MIKPLISAAALSLMLFSAAWALPVATSTQGVRASSADSLLVEVGKKYGKKHYGGKHYKHYNKKYYGRGYGRHHYRGRYRYGNRYWGHRYNYRPYNWQALGCIVVGPVWYCP